MLGLGAGWSWRIWKQPWGCRMDKGPVQARTRTSIASTRPRSKRICFQTFSRRSASSSSGSSSGAPRSLQRPPQPPPPSPGPSWAWTSTCWGPAAQPERPLAVLTRSGLCLRCLTCLAAWPRSPRCLSSHRPPAALEPWRCLACLRASPQPQPRPPPPPSRSLRPRRERARPEPPAQGLGTLTRRARKMHLRMPPETLQGRRGARGWETFPRGWGQSPRASPAGPAPRQLPPCPAALRPARAASSPTRSSLPATSRPPPGSSARPITLPLSPPARAPGSRGG